MQAGAPGYGLSVTGAYGRHVPVMSKECLPVSTPERFSLSNVKQRCVRSPIGLPPVGRGAVRQYQKVYMPIRPLDAFHFMSHISVLRTS
jgi:hypothetical protein